MKRTRLFLLIIASCMMIMPTKLWADGLDSVPKIENKKTLPYPRATKAVPASAMEYDSIAQCFVVRDAVVDPEARTLSNASGTTKAASSYTEDGVVYGYFGNQLSSDDMDEMKQMLESWDAQFKCLEIDSILSPAPGKRNLVSADCGCKQ